MLDRRRPADQGAAENDYPLSRAALRLCDSAVQRKGITAESQRRRDFVEEAEEVIAWSPMHRLTRCFVRGLGSRLGRKLFVTGFRQRQLLDEQSGCQLYIVIEVSPLLLIQC